MYNPESHLPISNALGAVSFPIDARSLFYDESNFKYRPYLNTAEVLSYLPVQFRNGFFDIVVNTGGTLVNGVITGGINTIYWFAKSTSNADLTVKQTNGDFVPVSGTALPHVDGSAYTIVGVGTFTQAAGGSIVTTALLNILSSSATIWSIAVEIPIHLDGYATSEELENTNEALSVIEATVNGIVTTSAQLSDNVANFESGSYRYNTGVTDVSVNQLRTKMISVLPEWVGQQMTISGFGQLTPTGGARIVVKNSAGTVLFIVGGNTTDYTPVTFIMPAGAATVGFGIANILGIGNNPTDNEFVNKFVFNMGVDAMPYTDFGTLVIDKANVNYNMELKDEEGIQYTDEKAQSINNKINPFIKDSPNVIDYLTVFESGQYHPTTGAPLASNNQLRTKMIPVLPEWVGQKMTVSGFGTLAAAGGARVVIKSETGSVLFIVGGNGSNFIPVTFDVPEGAYTIGFGVANVVGIGLTPFDNSFIGTFQVELGMVATDFVAFGETILDLTGSDVVFPSNSSFDESEIVIIKNSATAMTIYFHTGNGSANNIWFGVDFVHEVKAVTPAQTTSNFNTWKLDEGYLCERLGPTNFIKTLEVIQTGVWENAMYTDQAVTGYRNALGSIHGNELMEEITILVDGTNLDITFTEPVVCSHLSIFQRSNFMAVDSTTDVVAKSLKQWDISVGLITIKNNIKGIVPIPFLQNSFIGMCAVNRKYGDIQVTTTAVRDDEFKKYDVSEPLFGGIIHTGIDLRNKRLDIWGNNFGIDFNILERIPELPDCGIWLQDSELYNKIYSPFGAGVLNNGDERTVVFSVRPFVK